jgi:MFS family permease
VSRALRRSFNSLSIPNYRRYFTGQVVSISGNWMQIVAESWLVLRLTNSGVALGVNTALQFTPMLVAGAYGGVLADRWPKRRLLTVTQTLMALPALTLFALNEAGSVKLWMIYVLVFLRGSVLAVDNPARQSFVSELVGPSRVVNAVSLNSVIVQTGRIAGPALAGAVIAVFGVGPCFALNALSFFVMIAALRAMDPRALQQPPPRNRARGQLRTALRVVRETPALWIPLMLMAIVGTLSFNFVVLLPLLARFTFHGGAGTYAVLTTGMGVGAVLGALWNGARGTTTPAIVTGSAFAFGAALAAAAAAPDLPIELIALAATGAASVVFSASVNASLQLAAAPELRGRVMALYAVVFIGSNPLGGPLTGWLSGVAGVRAGLALGAAAALVAGVVGVAAFARAGHPVGAALARR